LSGGTGVTTKTGTGAVVLGTSPSISGAVMSTMGSSVITSGTAQASTSGTSIDFTGIPSWVKRITVMLSGVSTSGTSQKLFRLGTGSTTYTTTGYISTSLFVTGANVGQLSFTDGFNLYNAVAAADIINGAVVFTNITGNTWVCSGMVSQTVGTVLTVFTNGSIALGAALTAVRITSAGGTDTFDAGSINILYE